MTLIGLDIGTTGCKACVFDTDGHLLAQASREYSIDIPHPNWAEQDGEKVWALAQQALREAHALASRPEAIAIGLSVQGEAIMPVDQVGQALGPAILGMDTRTSEQNAWLEEKFSAHSLFDLTGMPIHTINTLPKLLWIKEHQPDIWRKAARFLLYEDFLINKMTGKAMISRCLASRTQLFDLKNNRWSEEILTALELDPSRLAVIKPSGYPVGRLVPELTAALELGSSPVIVTGGHDQACGALGVGLIEPGLAMVSTGTAEVVEVALASPALNEIMYQGNISVYAHVVSGLYLAMTLNHSGGLLLRWFRDTFGHEEVLQALRQGMDTYDILLKDASSDPTGLLVLPHFAGSGTPTFDTQSKGAIIGLTFATRKPDLAKAILEGLCYELRVNLDLLQRGGVQIDQLRAIGGGARSALWLQLKADITGIPVVRPQVTEAASWGAALMAGEGAGLYPNAARHAADTVTFAERFSPNSERQARYQAEFERYQQVYPTLASLLHAMG